MRFNDAIIGAVLVVFAIAEIAYTRTFPSLHGQNYGPNLFPILIGVGLLGCGCVLVLRGLMARRALQREKMSASGIVNWADFSSISKSRHAKINAALIVLVPMLYIFFSDTIGFIPLCVTACTVLIYRLGSSFGVALAVAVVTTGVIQFVFAKILLVPLPPGWLQAFI